MDNLPNASTGEKGLEVAVNAGHLFEKPGALDEVARLAHTWFKQHLKTEKSDFC